MPIVLNRFTHISLWLTFFAVIQSVFALAGVVSITDSSNERIAFGVIELITMALLIVNAVAIMRFMAKQDCSIAYRFSKLCVTSLLLCFIGDIVNRNFLLQFYQYDNVIKHSYLADSVLFFFPGYLILVIALAHFAVSQGLQKRFIALTSLLTTVIALVTYFDMHLASTAPLLTLITAAYSVLVSVLAVSALWLIKSCAGRKLHFGIYCTEIGLVFAMLADAIIGKFWIFGNHGAGYFPTVSHINWIIYFASQALIQQLPIGLLQTKLIAKTN
ncbi:MAG: hypothetical protein ACPG52_11905 [Cognaticolwellia sp.]